MKQNTWNLLKQLAITVLTALLTALGATACVAQ